MPYAGSPPPFNWNLSDSSDDDDAWLPLMLPRYQGWGSPTLVSNHAMLRPPTPPLDQEGRAPFESDGSIVDAGTGGAARAQPNLPALGTPPSPEENAILEASSGSKRLRSEDPEEEEEEESRLRCVICTKLVEDAVQSPCCGTLHCRACLARWLSTPSSCSKCAVCRRPISSALITDVRAERESAAAARGCCYVEHGCTMKGNRKEMREHESSCEFIPLSALRSRVDELERREKAWQSAVRRRNVEIEHLKLKNEGKRLQIQNLSGSKDELIKAVERHAQWARTFLSCSLKHDSGADAMKALHDVPVALKTYRDDIQGRPSFVFSFFLTDVLLNESNYNVSAVFVRTAGIVCCPADDLTVTLLHPFDPKLNVIVRVSKERWLSLQRGGSITVPNIIASDDLGKYCVEGKFYLSHTYYCSGGRSEHRQPDDQYACHCGYRYRSLVPSCVSRACRRR